MFLSLSTANQRLQRENLSNKSDAVDMVSHPPHYTSHPRGYEALDVIEVNPFYNLAAAMKYIWRVSWGGKFDNVEDLKKAAFYINREISRLEQQEQ